MTEGRKPAVRSKIVRIVIWGLVGAAVVVVACIRYAGSRRNGLIGEAEARIADGDSQLQKLEMDANRLSLGDVPKALAGDPTKLAEAVAKTNEGRTRVVEDYRAAVANFDAARKVAWNGVVLKYLDLIAQAYKDRADAEEARRKAIALKFDKSNQSKDELDKKLDALIQENVRLQEEFLRLSTEAEQLRDDNPDKFN